MNYEKKHPPRFIVDSMLGTLTKRLRMLGIDAAYDAAYDKDIDDSEIRYRALAENRIVLTGDRQLAAQLKENSVLVTGENVDEEFSSIVHLLKPFADSLRPLENCLECNITLEKLKKEDVRPKVPDHTFNTEDNFMGCPECGNVYWGGSHAGNMMKLVDKMMDVIRSKEYA